MSSDPASNPGHSQSLHPHLQPPRVETILTGDRPTGPLHLGHLVGSLNSRVALQETHRQYVMLADVQALTDNFDDPQKVCNNVITVAKDYLSVGIDPTKTTIFIQSQIPEIAELTIYYMNLVTVGRLERNPTVKSEIQQKGLAESLPAGFLCYPINQAADITIFRASLVPVGDDQLPMIEQTNEIVRRFNRIYSPDHPCLTECRPFLSQTTRLVGIDGKAKASKSLGNAILLSDSPEAIAQKVGRMFTDPQHLKVSDPGRVEGNVVFAYLDAFATDSAMVAELKAQYTRGGLADRTIKDILTRTLQDLLLPIRERRAAISDQTIREILAAGTVHARRQAQETMAAVRDAIGLRYS